MTQANQKTLNSKETPEFWHNHIQAHEKSGLTFEDYCQKHSLSFAKFRYRRNRYIDTKKEKSVNQFVAVKITEPTATPPSQNKPLCIVKFIKGHELQIYDLNTLTVLL